MCGASLASETVAREERKVVTVLFCDLVGFTAKAEQLDPEDVRAVLGPYHARLRARARAPRRHGREVHRRRRDGALRRARRARGRSRARGPRRARDPRLRGRGGARAPGRDHDRRGARLARRQPVRGRRDGLRGRRQHGGAPAERRPGQRDPRRTRRRTARRARRSSTARPRRSRRRARPSRSPSGRRPQRDRASASTSRTTRAPSSSAASASSPSCATPSSAHGTSASRSSSRSSASRGSARADSCTSSRRSSTPTRSSSRGARAAASPTATGSPSGRSPRSSRRRPASSSGTPRRKRPRSSTRLSKTPSRTQATPRWVESHLRPLVGLETETGLGGDRRGEAFAAWRRFLEALAEQRPLVLVFEDLHWADEGLLDFVDELVDWLSGVPLLVVCTARPELLERRPGWGGGKLNASTLGLSPLSSDQTALLISHVLERSLLPAEIQQALLERSEGNPLYAEQFAQLYLERGSARGPATARDAAGDRRRAPRRPLGRGEGCSPGRVGRRQGLLDGRAAHETTARRRHSCTRSSARAS